jgi:pyruvate formate lyase activating enzyme
MNCNLCPRNCSIADEKFGFCGTRTNRNGKIVSVVYGKCTGLAVDPIEKKPLNHFLPGSRVLSLGTIGCNLSCSFCQNWHTAQSGNFSLLSVPATPEDIAARAKRLDCRSAAFTYNEPITWAEYAIDTAKVCRREGIKTVAVSNGYISEEQREPFFGAMDAANIDLKSFSADFYREQCRADIEPVKETLIYLAGKSNFHLEITTLLIPTLNDSEEEIDALSRWICRHLGAEVPLHFSAYHPAGRVPPIALAAPPHTLFRAREIAMSNGLLFVYTGNIDDPAGQTTYCPQCRQAVISRNRFALEEYEIDEECCCKYCGQTITGELV